MCILEIFSVLVIILMFAIFLIENASFKYVYLLIDLIKIVHVIIKYLVYQRVHEIFHFKFEYKL